MTTEADHLFGAMSQRSVGTAPEASVRLEEAAVIPQASPTSPSPGPVSVVSVPMRVSPAERSTRYHQSLVQPRRQEAIVSERAALAGTGITPIVAPPPPMMRSTSPMSASIRSASDLSDLHGRSKKHRRHRSRSSSRSRSPHKSKRHDAPAIKSARHTWSSEHRKSSHREPVRTSHRRAERASSSSSDSSVVSRKRRSHRRHDSHRSRDKDGHLRHREAEPTPMVVEEIEVCGRCTKPRMTDPLDPQLAGLSTRQKERIRLEIIQRIVKMKENNPSERIKLPVRGINDPVVCYRRYVRIARHLYAKRSIPSYQLFVLAFAFVVQMVLSVMFGAAAIEYLTKECEQISKYNSVFYEMGCRAYSPHSSSQSPEYRFALQLVSPIILIAIGYFVGKYTPVPSVAINMFTNLASTYLKNQEGGDFRTLLNDEELDEPDYSSDSEEDEPHTTTAEPHRHRRREPMVHVPDLEAQLPEASMGTAALQAMLPTLINTVTSQRALPEGSRAADGAGLMGTVLNLVNAFTGGSAQVPVRSQGKPPPTEVMYAD